MCLSPFWVCQADHPRLCGDHLVRSSSSWAPRGSPPLMRGPQFENQISAGKWRITPAYAGTTYPPCGPICDPEGSPPLMRGPHRRREMITEGLGITPAYAGTTCFKNICRQGPQDHPRLCGDHQCSLRTMTSLDGSPPLMRGPHGVTWASLVGVGITPAYAGTTCC